MVILHGEAPKQLDQLEPLKINIEGTIGSPLAFLQKRVGDINQIKIPVMSGSTPVEIDVETYAYVDGGSVSIALQSAGANDIVEGMRCEQIDHEIDELRKVAPDIVIIEQ